MCMVSVTSLIMILVPLMITASAESGSSLLVPDFRGKVVITRRYLIGSVLTSDG